MSPILPLESHPAWRNLGKRYLRLEDFISLCDAVGLYRCTEHELEECERERWMFPVARMIMPEEYARAFWMHMLGFTTKFEFDERFLPFHGLDWAIRYRIQASNDSKNWDLRHPIDRVWGQVDGLVRPVDEEHVPWESYTITLRINDREIRESTVTHFYHYWQIYELYQIRRFRKGMYQDNAPMPYSIGLRCDDLQALLPFFDAVSYFVTVHGVEKSAGAGCPVR
jgi:hypothetical protein